jgi:3-hydroxyacyl-[acyl-carrier-protein] dehydratase
MLLEYFQMIDSVETIDLEAGTLEAVSTTPEKSPVFEGHFPGMPLVPGVLLIETMAQACGFLVLARTDFAVMPFLMSVDSAKMRSFVEPSTRLDIAAELVHEGSGYAVVKGRIASAGKRICDTQLKLRLIAADNEQLAAVVRGRAEEVGLQRALSDTGARQASGDGG